MLSMFSRELAESAEFNPVLVYWIIADKSINVDKRCDEDGGLVSKPLKIPATFPNRDNIKTEFEFNR